MKTLKSDNAAVVKGRTIFLKTVKGPTEVKRILQPASTNSKLGAGKNLIMRGRWRNMRMYQLTLEERNTCPRSCNQWANCYGNNMYLANRLDHKSAQFLPHLAAEVAALAERHPEGFVVRLHVLGDFYSVSYVNFWKRMLRKHEQLRIFGYTHRHPGTPIGDAVAKLNKLGAWVRYSDLGGPMSANVAGEGIPCPEQTGKTASCLTCGLCWQTTKPIHFKGH